MAKAKLPRYVAWRGGRPRWIPSPKLRRAGWKGRDLKSDDGQFLGFEAASEIASRINADVDRWLHGQPTLEFHLTPNSVSADSLLHSSRTRSLQAAWNSFTHSRHYLKLSPKTKQDYTNKIRAFLAFAGSDRPDAWTPGLMEEWVEKRADQLFATKALGWSQTRWNNSTAPAKAVVRGARHEDMTAREEGNTPGQAQVLGELAVIRRLFSYCIKPLEWTVRNPASGYGAEGLRPRIRVISKVEEQQLLNAAAELDIHWMADAILIGIETGQRSADLFNLTWGNFAENRLRYTPSKTRRSSGAKVDAPISNRLAECLSQMSLRSKERENTEKIFIGRNGRVMTRDDASAAMIEISAKAKVVGVLMKDCRDTAVVRLAEAGCTPFEIASITGHSLKTVTTILRHYFVPTATIADNAIAKLNRQNR
jgi:integrase